MKIESKNINKSNLKVLITTKFGLDIISIQFNPMGEDSYSYIIKDSERKKYFVKIYTRITEKGSIELSEKNKVVNDLRETAGIKNIVYPLKALDGEVVHKFNKYYLSVFSYIEGITKDLREYTEEQITLTAKTLAEIHESTNKIDISKLQNDKFNKNYKDSFNLIFKAITNNNFKYNRYSTTLKSLLLDNKGNIYKRLEKFNMLQNIIRKKNVKTFITHGDPNWANILIDRKGHIYFIDWDTIGLRPLEQDLLFFTGKIEEKFFLEYAKYRKSFNILPELFGYYAFVWDFQEILEYSQRILKTNESILQSKADLKEVESYITTKDDKSKFISRMRELKDIVNKKL